ncbi:hypothetical protein N8I77_000502 [Diaporthe amygdali]|uniref:DUF6590 domain-containing protein n=1 Tax=Phomopsis amygdali TaxID=1214568 RepID=A0AAD9SQ43_PHOAM|nr:hypothetical protein N8I77_000502 [Diaporthe amygdali]
MGQVDASTDVDVQFDSDPDDCEYDGQYDTDEGDSDFEEATTRNRSIEPKQDTALEAEVVQLAKEANSDLASDLWSPQDVTGVDQAHLSSETVDYFLVKLPAEEAKPGTQVVVVTSYCELTGFILPGAQRVKMNGFYGFQNLLAVRLSVPIRIGDSGSAVFDTSTGCFYGHIVLASAPDTIAYIVPSVDIFTEISTRFGEFPTLDMGSSIINEEKPSRDLQQEQSRVDAPGSVSHLLDHARNDSRSRDSSESVKSNSSRSDSLQFDLDESSRPVQATETGHTPSSPRYEIYSSDEFEPGDVFKTLWSEPFAPSDTFPSKDFQSPGIWTGPRVFIVVRSGDDHSLCIPIRTYGKMGCTKSGVRPHQHGIVYDKSSEPELLPGEPKLGFSPIRFESWSQECIGKEARVDYSCFTTVEHDIGVAFIGAIMYDDWWIVQDAVDSCWNNSRGHRDKSKEKRSQRSARASRITTTYGFPVQKASPDGFEEKDLSDWDPIYSANTFWSTYESIGEPE